MSNSKNSKAFGSLALIASGIIGGIAPIAAKYALLELSPLTVLFLRLLIMLLPLLPLFIIVKLDFKNNLKNLLLLGLFWLGNVTFFITGVKYTTAVASQILYALVPIFIIAEHYFISKTSLKKSQILSIALGLIGTLLIITQSSTDELFQGAALGNTLIFLATICWSFYLLLSKKLSTQISPLGLTLSSALTATTLSGFLWFALEGQTQIHKISSLSQIGIYSLLFLGLVVGIVMIYLYQYGIKYGSVLLASSNVYVATLTAGILGFIFFNEKVTLQFTLGSVLVLGGAFYSSIYPLLKRP